MKAYHLFFMYCLICGLSSCQEDSQAPTNAIDVEAYIESLKTGQYQFTTLPDFTHEDIPALLEYINETNIISDFPRNPISSFYMKECELGVYALWTIESIRAQSIQSDRLVMNFPSQNPVLMKRNSNDLELITDRTAYENASQAYHDWWQANKDKRFSEFNSLDPLASTNYTWH